MSGEKEKIYVSIGVDCDTARILKQQGKRKIGFPFDWTVSYKDISDIFKNGFVGYGENVKPIHHEKFNSEVQVNSPYKILFLHHRGADHLPQCIRRTERLKMLMEDGSKELILVRAGHRDGHHEELNYIKIDSPHFDETKDMMEIKNFIISKYPDLKFRIYLYNQCKLCNDQTIIDQENIVVKHIEHEQLSEEIKFI